MWSTTLVVLALLLGGVAARAQDSGVSVTPDHQILLELRPGDTEPASLFDLNGRTVVFTPDDHGGYSREVTSLAWESAIGETVGDGHEIHLQSFMFDFARQWWGSFFVNRHGVITFGEPLTYAYWDAENRFGTMAEVAGQFVTAPTISPLYKPMLGGRTDRYGATQHVAQTPDQVVVTWSTSEPDYYVHGVPPDNSARFQVSLRADGTIRFSYTDVSLGDGIVGLFPDHEIEKGDPIASIADSRDSDLPGHLDLLEAALYETNTDLVILEFTMRDSIPTPSRGQYEYRLMYDTDQPWWTDNDRDFYWAIAVDSDGEVSAYGPGVARLVETGTNQVALLASIEDYENIEVSVIADIIKLDNGSWRRQDAAASEVIQFPPVPDMTTNLSQSDNQFTTEQVEVFHYRSVPDARALACRVIEVLGDDFDLFVFHNEFRVDSQESGTPWNGQRADVKGIGVEHRNRSAPCGDRLMGHWKQPVWMQSDHVVDRQRDEEWQYDRGLLLFAHELTHAWTAHLSYLLNGERAPLFGQYCRCHWQRNLHVPAAFPWHDGESGPRSLMGGRYWQENTDGTFTPIDGYWNGGHSWLDLYAMGLAEASEVPDMFIVRNAEPVTAGDWWGPHSGAKEVVTIDQIIAAEGPRVPSAAQSQKNFNAGFVYLLEPGQSATSSLLELHKAYRDKVIEHWAHVTGERSRVTSTTSR